MIKILKVTAYMIAIIVALSIGGQFAHEFGIWSKPYIKSGIEALRTEHKKPANYKEDVDALHKADFAKEQLSEEKSIAQMKELETLLNKSMTFPHTVDEMTVMTKLKYSEKWKTLVYVYKINMTKAQFDAAYNVEKFEAGMRAASILQMNFALGDHKNKEIAIIYRAIYEMMNHTISHAYFSSDGEALFGMTIEKNELNWEK